MSTDLGTQWLPRVAMVMGCRPPSYAPPNPRLQRTPLRAPLSRKPLGVSL